MTLSPSPRLFQTQGLPFLCYFFRFTHVPVARQKKKRKVILPSCITVRAIDKPSPPPSSKNLATIIYNFFQLKKLNRILLSNPAVPLQTPQTNSTPSNLPFLPLLHTAQPHTFPPTPSPHSSFLTPHPHDSNLTILTHTSAPIDIEDSPSSALSASSLHSTPNLSLFILRSLDHLRMHSPVF